MRLRPQEAWTDRGKNRTPEIKHLRHRRGFPVAFPYGLSVVFSEGISFVSGMFQRIVTCPGDFHWNCQMHRQWHFRMDFIFVRSGV